LDFALPELGHRRFSGHDQRIATDASNVFNDLAAVVPSQQFARGRILRIAPTENARVATIANTMRIVAHAERTAGYGFPAVWGATVAMARSMPIAIRATRSD
jgi:hypothetical protein